MRNRFENVINLSALSVCLFSMTLSLSLAAPSQPLSKIASQYKTLSSVIHTKNHEYGRLSDEILLAASMGLSELQAGGKAPQVELVDLWSIALQEGFFLLKEPTRLWGKTMTGGSFIVGPWGLSLSTIQAYGASFGVGASWSEDQVERFLWKHPETQAKIAALVIQDFYWTYGKRAPLALQSYYNRDAYLQGKIAQGPWDAEVGDSVQSGFFGKQVLVGNKVNIHGLLYWLWVLNDTQGVKDALATWKNQKQPNGNGTFAIGTTDIKYCSCHGRYKDYLKSVLP